MSSSARYTPTLSLREDERNEGHTRVSVFIGRDPGSRGLSGQLVIRTDEWDDLQALIRGEPDPTTFFRAIVRLHPDLPNQMTQQSTAADCTIGRCPHSCGSHADPIPNDDDPDDEHRRRNPAKCPDCDEVSGYEDWAEVCEACGEAARSMSEPPI